jgi:hypothetical protein
MNFSAASSVTAILIIALGVFVMYTRLKNWFDSNIPIIFYVIFLIYMGTVDGVVPFWLTCAAFGLGLMLRFEFMNIVFQRVVKFLELGALGTMLYLSTSAVLFHR